MRFGIAHGRFQPPHKQHLEYMLSVKERCDTLVVGVTNPFRHSRRMESASPHRHLDDSNPLSFFERQEIISKALLDLGIDPRCFRIVPFDLFQPDTWRDCLPDPGDCVFYVRVFSDWEKEKIGLFEKNGFRCEIIDPGCTKRMTGSEVRDLVRKGDSSHWRNLVPAATVSAIEDMDGRL